MVCLDPVSTLDSSAIEVPFNLQSHVILWFYSDFKMSPLSLHNFVCTLKGAQKPWFLSYCGFLLYTATITACIFKKVDLL